MCDGLTFFPKNKVDWMVCDIVERPSIIVEVVYNWVKEKKASNFIFNLKLPMKKRYEEVTLLLYQLNKEIQLLGITCVIKCKQLFHDREEVTVFLKIV